MNDWKQRLGMVYSTNPDFEYTVEQEAQEETLEPSKQDLRVWIDRKHRGGKTVTLVKGFVGSEQDLAELGVIERIIPEFGGATAQTVDQIAPVMRDAIFDFLRRYDHMSAADVVQDRYSRFRKF